MALPDGMIMEKECVTVEKSGPFRTVYELSLIHI